jgi:hypothetical protein
MIHLSNSLQIQVSQLTNDFYTRVRNELSPEEMADFDPALRLYYTNTEANDTNLKQPVKKIQDGTKSECPQGHRR